MGKPKKSKKKDIKQKLIEDDSLTASTLHEGKKGTDTVITWVIRNYSELRESVSYEMVARKYSCSWRLTIRRESFSLCAFVDTDSFVDNFVIFFLRNDGKVLDSTLPTVFFHLKLYSATLDERQLSRSSGRLIDDTLIIQCMYIARPYENDIILTPGLQYCNELKSISDVDILLNDLKKLYLSGLYSDLILRVGQEKFKVHKLILRRQSKYFERRLTEDPNWTGDDLEINTPPAVMNEVLLYLYSGEMRNLQLSDMYMVYNIASTLEIASLQTICVHYFKSIFSVHHIRDFLYLAIKQRDTDFQEEITHFLNKQPESVRQKKVWADVIKEVSKLIEDKGKNEESHNI